MKYDFLSLGSAVVDKIVCIDDSFLSEMNIEKGSTCALLNQPHDIFFEKLPNKNILCVPGGSAGNATKVIAGLGKKCAYIAKVGADKWGSFYQKSFAQRQIDPLFSTSPHLPTGSMVILVSHDGERSMCSDLRACQSITPDDIPKDCFSQTRLFHIDGYNFFYPGALRRAIENAKAAKCPISLDVSSHEIVRSHYDPLMAYLESQSFYFIFANEREAYELTGLSDPLQACEALSKYARYVTIMMGEKGSVTHYDGKIYSQFTDPIRPVDTTGAGDMYVGGFLYGYLNGREVEECMLYGKTTAAEGIQVFGGELSPGHLQRLQKQLASLELANI